MVSEYGGYERGAWGESCKHSRLMLSYLYMTVTLPITLRTKGTNIDAKARLENIPGVIYGPKQAPEMIMVSRKAFEKTFKTAGESTIIELTGLKTPIQVLVKDVSFAPTKGGIVHVDFYALEKGKEVVTHVPLHFVGESEAVKAGAVVNKVLHEVTVACQAADLPAHIDVDLGLLKMPEDRITVADIVTPKGVRITDEVESVVAIADVITEVAESEAEPIAITDIPVEQKGKVEEPAA